MPHTAHKHTCMHACHTHNTHIHVCIHIYISMHTAYTYIQYTCILHTHKGVGVRMHCLKCRFSIHPLKKFSRCWESWDSKGAKCPARQNAQRIDSCYTGIPNEHMMSRRKGVKILELRKGMQLFVFLDFILPHTLGSCHGSRLLVELSCCKWQSLNSHQRTNTIMPNKDKRKYS